MRKLYMQPDGIYARSS